MSLEQSLERIADALESLVEPKRGIAAPVEKPKAKKEKVEAPEAVDPLADDGSVPTAITLDEVHTALREYMAKNKVDKTKALMIKHGADKAKPVVSSIPAKNYAVLMAEIKKEV